MLPLFIDIEFLDFKLKDIIDILLVAYLIYRVYKIVRGTAAIKIFIGIIAIYLFWKIVETLQMHLLTEILGQFIGVGVIALIIVFQQELRSFLLSIGNAGTNNNSLLKWSWNKEDNVLLDTKSISEACKNMSSTKTGALIVIGDQTNLDHIKITGDEINANISPILLENIFFKNNPLHDGAIIIENNKITHARCVLPTTQKKELPSKYGMRHRAALGITETTDAVAIIVSEETGNISLSRNGEIEENLTHLELEKRLKELFVY